MRTGMLLLRRLVLAHARIDPDLHQVVRDHSQPDPALEAIPAAAATVIQSVSSFQRADAAPRFRFAGAALV